MWADPPAAKAIIGVVPAEVRLFERLSGGSCWSTPGGCAACRPPTPSRAAQLLDVLDLAEDANRLVADYSTGMRKKIALGCALIHNPSVLFLDEPLEGVDPVSADVIRRLLTRFPGSGSTVLFSSHVMELVEQVCDHVPIIDKGEIVATGTITRSAAARRCSRRSSTWSGRGRPVGGTDMARLLVQLKLRLLRNALRASNGARVTFIISTVLALAAAAVGLHRAGPAARPRRGGRPDHGRSSPCSRSAG